MEKPKTYMLRLYPDKASDQILINYLKGQQNIQQYLKKLIEKDIENKSIVKTIREIMEEYFQMNNQENRQHLSFVSEDRNKSITPVNEITSLDEAYDIPDYQEKQDEDYSSDEVDSLPSEALNFLAELEKLG